uniref:Transmembrane protein 141 n=1 Tax=Gallus gallus TaxID=9031 RepID=A0A8V1AGU7_CHICK
RPSRGRARGGSSRGSGPDRPEALGKAPTAPPWQRRKGRCERRGRRCGNGRGCDGAPRAAAGGGQRGRQTPGAAAVRGVSGPRLHEGHRHLPGGYGHGGTRREGLPRYRLPPGPDGAVAGTARLAVRAGSGAAFAVQKLVNRRLPYALQWNLLLSVAAGSLASYTVTRAETQKCSDFWIYLETGMSPRERSVADGVPQPADNLLSPEDAESVSPPVRRNKYGDVVE